jgi:hypothetical protein
MTFSLIFVTSSCTTNLCQHEWQNSQGKNVQVKVTKAEDILRKLPIVALMRGLVVFQDSIHNTLYPNRQ